MKYAIQINRGCTTFGTIINGKNVDSLTREEHAQFLTYLLDKIREQVYSGEITLDSVIELMPSDKEVYDSEICDSCGDTTSSTYWEI